MGAPPDRDAGRFFSQKLIRIRESYRPRPLDLPTNVLISSGFADFDLPMWYLRSLVRHPVKWTTIGVEHVELLLPPTVERVAREIRAAVRACLSVTECVLRHLAGDEIAVWRLPSDHPAPLETVLARYTGVDPGSLILELTPQGKPVLPGSRLRFNLAHSGEVALVAVARDRDVGVDVERVRPDADRWALVATPSQLVSVTNCNALRRPSARTPSSRCGPARRRC